MEKNLKITKDLKFDFEDLMANVDFDHEFTLRDLLRAVNQSLIDPLVLARILRCPYIQDYWAEAEKQSPEQDSDIEYLEIYYWVSKSTFDGKRDDGSCWGFHGVGNEGVVSQDIIDNYPKEEVDKMREEGYRQAFAVEFSPMYNLADYPIRLRKEIIFTDYDVDPKEGTMDRNIDVIPSITLMDLLYWVFWEFSFFGSIEQRDKKISDLQKTVENVKSGKVKTIPWETAKGI